MKKYLEPTIEVTTFNRSDCILTSSGELKPGDSLWDNETPLVPFSA